VTKDGADPLLPKEINTAHIVEPPTELEMNHAITHNIRDLVVVVCLLPQP
jgi:[calcium/calmodulin-dependent protein kinase] kinase